MQSCTQLTALCYTHVEHMLQKLYCMVQLRAQDEQCTKHELDCCRPDGQSMHAGQTTSAWQAQRQGHPFRAGGHPFKGRGNWKHDLFEELTQLQDEAKPVTLHDSANAVAGMQSAQHTSSAANDMI